MERKIDRFDKYMEHKKLNDNKVTRDARLAVGTLGKSRKEGKDLSNKTVEKILKSYPDINEKWLLYGEEPMLKYYANDVDSIEEPLERYGKCKDCVAKEKEIGKLNNRISFLNESIQECKKEASEKDREIGKLISILEQNGINYRAE